MSYLSEVSVRVDLDTSEISQGMREISNSTNSIKKTLLSVGKIVGGAFAVGKIVQFGKSALQSASDLQEMENKFNVVFKNTGKQVDAWATQYSKAIGRSKTEVKGAVSNLGDLLTGFGMAEENAGGLSEKVVALSYDLASFNNVNDEEAIQAMSSALLGQHDAVKKLGVAINEATLTEAMHQMGIKDKWKDLDEATKMQVRYKVMTMQTSNAQGDAKRSADSYANQLKALKARLKDVTERIGGELLPVATEFISYLIENAVPVIETMVTKFFEFVENMKKAPEWIKANQEALTLLGIAVGTITTAIGAYNLYLKWATITEALYTTWTTIATTATSAFSAVIGFLTSPITLVILAIGALIAVGYLLVKHWDTVKPVLLGVWKSICDGFNSAIEWVKKTFSNAWNWIVGTFNKTKDKVTEVTDKVKGAFSDAWNSVTSTVSNAITKVKNKIGGIWDKAKEITNKVKGAFSGIFKGIKIPKFKFSGSLNPVKWASEGMPKVSVQWNANGGILDNPTFVGAGEAGAEAIVPLSNRRKMAPFAEAVARYMPNGGNNSNLTVKVESLVVREEADIDRVAEELYRLQQRESRARGGVNYGD